MSLQIDILREEEKLIMTWKEKPITKIWKDRSLEKHERRETKEQKNEQAEF